jgi:mRNA-degrading endonuclease toxin of MazEF toxin-antitoxin module
MHLCAATPMHFLSAVDTHPLRPPIGMVGDAVAHALISQVRVIDTKRLVRKIQYLEKAEFEMVRKAVRDML